LNKISKIIPLLLIICSALQASGYTIDSTEIKYSGIKTDAFSYINILGIAPVRFDYNLSYEHITHKKLSYGITLAYGYKHGETNNLDSIFQYEALYKGLSITPEIRYYPFLYSTVSGVFIGCYTRLLLLQREYVRNLYTDKNTVIGGDILLYKQQGLQAGGSLNLGYKFFLKNVWLEFLVSGPPVYYSSFSPIDIKLFPDGNNERLNLMRLELSVGYAW
jgi:hypothetical protein